MKEINQFYENSIYLSFDYSLYCNVRQSEQLSFVCEHVPRTLGILQNTLFYKMTCCCSGKNKLNQNIYADCFDKFT